MRAEAVVVGAGIAGAAVARFLAAGGSRVALVDRGHVGHGATGRSAGFLTSQHWTPLDLALTRSSSAICAAALPEGEAGIHRVGFLRVTSREEDVPLLRRRARELGRAGVTASFLSPRRLRRRFPWMEVEGLAAGLHTPDDGYVDPYDAAAGLVAQAKGDGCIVSVNNPVLAVREEGGRVVGVETAEGPVEAPTVVVAAGAWSRILLRPLGIALALKPYRVQALVTAPFPGLPPLPLLHELPGGTYLRPEGQGLLLGDGTEHVEADPEAYNREADFAVYTTLAAWLSRRVPVATGASVVRGWAGLCQATPDRLPLVGPLPEVEGLHVLAGFNGLGVMRGPALGRTLAQAILGAEPLVDLDPLRPARFPPGEEWSIREGFTLA